MPIPEDVINQMKCCLDKDGHISIESVVLNCGGSACKECIYNSGNKEMFDCNCCNKKHKKKDLLNAPVSKLADTMIHSYLNDLVQYVDEKIMKTTEALKEDPLIDELNLKIEELEIDVDIRVESLMEAIHKCRDECKLKLNEFKDSFKLLIKNKSEKSDVITKKRKRNDENELDMFREKQNELRFYQTQLNDLKDYLNKVEFSSSKFILTNTEFGEIREKKCWLNSSLILNDSECLSLLKMIGYHKTGELLYRASVDGFEARSFHSKCNDKVNTITIIKSNLNHVFGGFTSAAWSSRNTYSADRTAFIFSIRRNGKSENDKFMIKKIDQAIYCQSNYGPTFGSGHDIHICNQSNIYTGSFNLFGYAYNLPEGFEYGQDYSRNYLAGSYNRWLVTEIETYQIFI